MMVMLLFLVVVRMLGVGLGGHCQQLGHKVVLAGHCGEDLLAGQVIPRCGDDGGCGVLLAQQCNGCGGLLLTCGLGAAEQDAAGVGNLVVVELAKVLHIHLHLVHVCDGDKAVQLHIQRFGYGLHRAGDVGQLAHAGRLDEDAVWVILLHNLL